MTEQYSRDEAAVRQAATDYPGWQVRSVEIGGTLHITITRYDWHCGAEYPVAVVHHLLSVGFDELGKKLTDALNGLAEMEHGGMPAAAEKVGAQ